MKRYLAYRFQLYRNARKFHLHKLILRKEIRAYRKLHAKALNEKLFSTATIIEHELNNIRQAKYDLENAYLSHRNQLIYNYRGII